MKMYSLPSRACTQRAGRAIQGEDSSFSIGFVLSDAVFWWPATAGGSLKRYDLREGRSGRTSRCLKGSGSKLHSTSSGFVQGSDSSGSRYPIGESPGTRNRRGAARNQGWLDQYGVP